MTKGEIGFVVAVLAAGLASGVLIYIHRDDPVVEEACSEFRNVDRSAVPALCFSDFLGKDGGQ